MNKLYHIFKVYDYKGGELSYDTNCTLEEAFGSLYGETCLEDWTDEELKLPLKEALELLEDRFENENYAGDSGCSTAQIFVTTEGSYKLEYFDPTTKEELIWLEEAIKLELEYRNK